MKPSFPTFSMWWAPLSLQLACAVFAGALCCFPPQQVGTSKLSMPVAIHGALHRGGGGVAHMPLNVSASAQRRGARSWACSLDLSSSTSHNTIHQPSATLVALTCLRRGCFGCCTAGMTLVVAAALAASWARVAPTSRSSRIYALWYVTSHSQTTMAQLGVMVVPHLPQGLLPDLPLGPPLPLSHPAQRPLHPPAQAAASQWRLGASVVAWVASAHLQTPAGMAPGRGTAAKALATNASSAMLSEFCVG